MAKFCYDLHKPLVSMKIILKEDLKKNFISPNVYAPKKSFSEPFPTLTTSTHRFHCSYCGRNGHLKELCFDRLRAINAPKWIHNPKAFDFTFRGHVPTDLGPKRFWVSK